MKVTRRQFLKVSAGSHRHGRGIGGSQPGRRYERQRRSRAQAIPIKTGKQVPSICPYCSVGCGQIVTVDDAGKDYRHPGQSRFTASARGRSARRAPPPTSLSMNDLRWTKVKYRAPGSDHWEDKPLDWAMNRIAELVKQTRDANFNEFQEMPDGKGGTVKKRVMNTYAIASLGGATIDNEWNYAQQKLMHGLGVVYVENQARI